jgi:hypothetical protein
MAAAAGGDDAECPICCEGYNRTRHLRVTCPYCSRCSCRECSQRFTLDQGEASCMHCKAAWNREFADANFTRVFREGDLKRKREDVLLGVEEAMLPDTQAAVAMERERRALVERRDAQVAQVRALKLQLADAREAMYRASGRINALDAAIRTGAQAPEGPGGSSSGGGEERRQFLRHCPADGCRGFLSTQYKCGLCKVRVCARCLVPKTAAAAAAAAGGAGAGAGASASNDADGDPVPNGDGNDEADGHVCDPDAVATVEMLKRDTKPCPKCAAPIHKIDGCDQMWCTQCHTAFSWRSGRVVTGVVHNPHWYEYQRRVNAGGAIPRVPGDVPGGGGGCPAQGDRDLPPLARLPGGGTNAELRLVHRKLTHINHMELPRFAAELRFNSNRDLRMKYLLGELDKEQWKRLLQQREKRRLKDQALRQALEVLLLGSADILNRMMQQRDAFPWAEAKPQLEALREYANECLAATCKRFGCSYTLRVDATSWDLLT